MIRSYRYRLKPNVAQKMFFIKTFGCVRYIYNWALSKRIESFQNNNDDISWKDMSSMLTSLKKESDKLWLNDVSAECLQQSLIDLNSAYTNFFRRKKGFPNLHGKKIASFSTSVY